MKSGVSPAKGPRISVVSPGPFAVGSVVFRDGRDKLMCTVVAKATYALMPGVSAPLAEYLPIQEEDGHWDDNVAKSVHVPSDLAPFKKAPEVVVVGSAFAPGERLLPCVVARVVIGSVDKSVEAFGPRFFLHDGTLDDSARAKRFSLRYEYAAGGPDSDNPIGIDISRPDLRGRRHLPQLLPTGTELAPNSTHAPLFGLGPITSSWRPRAGGLTPQDKVFLADPIKTPVPQGFSAAYFQSAPMDQWLVRPLAANERILLENLHQKHQRLVMTLSGLEPQALVLRRKDEVIKLRGDLLVIDSDRAFCTLTFRGSFPLDPQEDSVRIVVGGVLVGTDFSPEAIRELARAVPDDDAEAIDVEDEIEMTREVSSKELSDVLPFAATGQTQSNRASYPDGVLPFSGNAPAQVPAPQPFSDETTPFGPPPILPQSRNFSPVAAAPITAPIAAPIIPAPARPAMVLPGLRGREAPALGVGAAAAASDAAAREEKAREQKAEPSRKNLAKPEKTPLRRLVVADLVWFLPTIIPRLKAMSRLAPIFAEPLKPRAPRSADEPFRPPTDPDRTELLKILSCATPSSAAEIRAALGEGLEDLFDLEPPLVFCGGELTPTMDEMDVLRATVAVAKSVAGTDKRLLSTIAVAEEALSAQLAPAPETLRNLVRQIETASSSLALPPRFVASQVERVVVENRKYKRRSLLGAPRVRADLVLAGGDAFPFYLPESAAGMLPLLPSFPVVALCEVRPKEDLMEVQAEALVCVALGRVLTMRS